MNLFLGDCLDKLKELKDNSVDSIVTDPPYGLSFMGKKWDYDVPSQEIWQECLRVLKHGGHLLAFAGSRTYHRMAVRIEDAGFEIRDQIMWVYGSGFPKSHNIGKAVDKKLGNERLSLGIDKSKARKDGRKGNSLGRQQGQTGEITQENSEWEGWGTALKPAHEPIVMARKPLSEKTVVDNVLEWGTGGINIDESRIRIDLENEDRARSKNTIQKTSGIGFTGNKKDSQETPLYNLEQGRFPANIIFDDEAGKILDEQSGILKSGNLNVGHKRGVGTGNSYANGGGGGIIDRNYGGDAGGASRFFYCPKTSKKDRDEGMEHLQSKTIKGRDEGQDKTSIAFKARPTERKNIHPTVKPTDLMLYLIRLVTPKNGITLDPFMGSGSTGKAAIKGGFDFIGIEREQEYFDIAKARIDHENNNLFKK